VQHVLGLLSGLWSLQPVRTLAHSASGQQLHLWVIQRDEDPDDMERVSPLDAPWERGSG
jgi:hypothetical protein